MGRRKKTPTNLKNLLRLWDRMPNEPDKAWKAFQIYRDLGPGLRTYSKVCELMGAIPSYKRTLIRWAKEFQWKPRAEAFDRHSDQQQQQLAQATLAPLQEKILEARAKAQHERLNFYEKELLLGNGVIDHVIERLFGPKEQRIVIDSAAVLAQFLRLGVEMVRDATELANFKDENEDQKRKAGEPELVELTFGEDAASHESGMAKLADFFHARDRARRQAEPDRPDQDQSAAH